MQQLDEVPILAQVLGPILRAAEKEAPEMRQAGPIPIMVLAALKNLGEDVPACVTPTEWLERHGQRVWDYQHDSSGEALAAIGKGGR